VGAGAGFVARAVALVIIQALGRSIQLREPAVLGESLKDSVAAVMPAVPPKGLLLDGQNLRAACRAAVDAVWEEAHLWVTALAGVAAESIGQTGDRLQRLQ
jgi:hypothetical protein